MNCSLIVLLLLALSAVAETGKAPVVKKKDRPVLPATAAVETPVKSDTAQPQPKQRSTVDKVLAVITVYQPDPEKPQTKPDERFEKMETKLILQSDLRPNLSDQVPSLQDVILRELIIFDGKRYHISVSPAEVDRHIARVQEQLKMSKDDLETFFKERGFTIEQAKKELEKNLLVEMVIDMRVKSKSLVPKQEIEKYNAEYPVITYQIRQAFVPFGYDSRAIKRARIEQDISSGAILESAAWQEPIALASDDFSLEKAFIKELAPGSVVKIDENTEGLFLLQLVAKKVAPLVEREQEIARKLGMERYTKVLQDYHKKLLAEASIRYNT